MNNNKIYDLNDPFDFSLLHLANPSLINNNNYFSKISQGSMKKNLYLYNGGRYFRPRKHP